MKICRTCHQAFEDAARFCPRDGQLLIVDPMLGAVLSGYRIEAWLAEGGLGVLYRAEHAEIKRTAAVKLLKREYLADSKMTERFAREARAVVKIGHPHLIDVFDVGTTAEGQTYYIMELLHGRSLSERQLARPMSFDEFGPLVIDACDALYAAHAQGIIHRDLKPDNIFLVEQPGQPPFLKVLDFGIAKLVGVDQDVQSKLTKTGMVLGTPQYMAPEQIEGAAVVDARADVYSLGVILYELAAGRLPFRGETLAAVLKAHLVDPPLKFEQGALAQGVAPELEAVVLKALARKTDDRYQSMHELREDLERILKRQQPAAADWWIKRAHTGEARPEYIPSYLTNTIPIRPPETPSREFARRSRTRWRTAALLALGTTVALAGIIVLSIDKWSLAPQPPASSQRAEVDTAALRSRALRKITAGLQDGDPMVRQQAIEMLACGRDPRHRTLLEPLLSDPDLQVRAASASALGALGSRGCLPALRAAHGKDPHVDVWIDEAALHLGDETARSSLRTFLESGDDATRLKAALVLTDDGDATAREFIEKLARSRAAANKESADLVTLNLLSHLARRGDRTARAELVRRIAEGSETQQAAVAELVARLGEEQGRIKLSQLGSNKASRARLLALRILASLDDLSGFDLFLQIFSNPKQPPAERQMAARGLGAAGDKGALPTLAPALDEANPAVRLAAAGAVLEILASDPVRMGGASADWATAALSDSSWSVREQAAAVLGDAEASISIPLLAKAIHDQRVEVRRTAARSLGRTRRAAAVPYLAEALDDQAGEVRVAALRSIGTIRDRSAAPILTRHLARATPAEKIVAAGQLALLGDRSQLPTLIQALRAPDPELRQLALEESGGDAATALEAGRAALADSSPAVRLSAALELARAGSSEGIATLQAGVKEGGFDGLRAFAALQRLGVKPVSAFDLELFSAWDAPLREQAARLAVQLGPTEALALLGEAIDDLDPRVRMAAVETIFDAERAPRGRRIALLRDALAGTDPALRAKAGLLLARLAASESTVASPVPATPVDLSTADQSTAADLGAIAEEQENRIDEESKEESALAMTNGELALKTGKYDVAIREFERAHRLNPKVPVAFSLGEAYRLLGDREPDHEAQLKDYRKAVQYYKKSRDKRAAANASELEELYLSN
jgi:serine/threonine protein kinase/HEAT repeat protein